MGGSPILAVILSFFVPVDAGGEQVFDIRRLDAAGALPIIIGQILDSQAAFNVAGNTGTPWSSGRYTAFQERPGKPCRFSSRRGY